MLKRSSTLVESFGITRTAAWSSDEGQESCCESIAESHSENIWISDQWDVEESEMEVPEIEGGNNETTS